MLLGSKAVSNTFFAEWLWTLGRHRSFSQLRVYGESNVYVRWA